MAFKFASLFYRINSTSYSIPHIYHNQFISYNIFLLILSFLSGWHQLLHYYAAVCIILNYVSDKSWRRGEERGWVVDGGECEVKQLLASCP